MMSIKPLLYSFAKTSASSNVDLVNEKETLILSIKILAIIVVRNSHSFYVKVEIH